MTLLLTGAGGFIGSALLCRLYSSPFQVRALYRNPPQAQLAGSEAVYGDLRVESLCESICKDVDVVIHLAGHSHIAGSKISHLRNTYETSGNLVKAAIAQGVQKFVYLSSTKANYPQHSPYADVKLATEQMLLDYHNKGDIRVVCLRPALVYGPGMRGNLATLLNLLQRPFLPVFPASSSPLGMISLEDCCQAILSALTNEELYGQCWELNDGQRYDLDTLTRQVRAARGYAMPWLQLPELSVKLAAKLAELSSPLTGTRIGMGTYRGLYEEPYRPDSRFSAVTGFVPKKTFYTELSALMESTQ